MNRERQRPATDAGVIDEPPPVLGTWPRVYAFVLLYLAAVILSFYLFTLYFAP